MAERKVAVHPPGSTAPGGYAATYTSLDAMHTGEAGDLVTATTNLVVEIVNSDGDWDSAPDTDGVIFIGWVCSVVYDILIKTVGGARNSYSDGKFNRANYILQSDVSTRCINVANGTTNAIHLSLDGLQFEKITTSEETIETSSGGSGSVVKFLNCYVKPYTNRIAWYGENANSNIATWFVNCIIDGAPNHCAKVGANSDIYIYNCTFSGATADCVEKDSAGTSVLVNNALFNNLDDVQDVWGTNDYNATDDGDGTNAVDISPGATEADDWNDAFVDYSNGDFRIKDTNSVLYQAGKSSSVDSNIPTTDIAGNPRTQGSESIGAFEYFVAAAGGTETVNLDALLNKTLTQDLSLDALLKKNIPITLSVDGVLSALRSIQTSMDAKLWDTYTADLSIDALLKRIGVETSLSIDAIIFEAGTGIATTNIDALLNKAGVISTLNIDGILTKSSETTTVIDAILLKILSTSLSLDALIQKTVIGTTAIDASLVFLKTVETKVDAILYSLTGAAVLLDALLSKTGQVAIAALDAQIYRNVLSTTVIDGIIARTLSRQINIDALLKKNITSSSLLDAVIYSTLMQTEPFAQFITVEERPAFITTEERPAFIFQGD